MGHARVKEILEEKKQSLLIRAESGLGLKLEFFIYSIKP
jgi:hypothetical protein